MAEKRVKIVAVIDGESGGYREMLTDVEVSTKKTSSMMEGIWQGVGQQITRAFVDVGRYAARQLMEGIGWVKDQLVSGVQGAAEFEAALALASTKGVKDLEGLRQGVLKVANDIGTGLVEQTQAFEEALRRGVGEENIVDFMTTANKLAEASAIDLNLATEGLMDTLNAYGMSVDRVTEIADKFITSQRLGKLGVGELTIAMGQLAPMASQLGIGLDELMASLIQGSTAGLKMRENVGGLRGILESLLKPSEQTQKIFREMGLSVEEVGEKLRTGGLMQFLTELGPAAMEKIAGSASELSLMLAILGQDAGASFQETMAAIQNSAWALETEFEKVENTTLDQWGDLISRIKILGAEALSPINDLLRQVLERVNANLGEKFPEIAAKFKEGLTRWLWGGVSEAQAQEINQMVADGKMSFDEAVEKIYGGGIGNNILKIIDEWTKSAGNRIVGGLDAYLRGDISFGQMFQGWLEAAEPYIREAARFVGKVLWEGIKEASKIGFEEWKKWWMESIRQIKMSDIMEMLSWGTPFVGINKLLGNEPIIGFQSGGIVPGIGRGDIVPAMLEPGEFVVPREIVYGRNGRDGLDGQGGKIFNVVINVEGARDPRAVAKEIQKILRDEERMGRGMGNWGVEFER